MQSAIRAKLLELGVRYDEELPDYILVMVVNKKTRQQMHEDLHLFLEDSTTPFVEWLHDQVLKKLQKVTIAKKKASRDFVPTVVVKQEEERKKRKNAAAAEDAIAAQTTAKGVNFVAKEEKPTEKTPEKSLQVDKSDPEVTDAPNNRSIVASSTVREPEKIVPAKITAPVSPEATRSTASLVVPNRTPDIVPDVRPADSRAKTTTKRPLEVAENSSNSPDKRVKPLVDSEAAQAVEDDENDSGDEKKLKSCVNKPKITSVVSVKNRLGILSPRKKFETHRNRDADFRRVPADKRFDKSPFESLNRRGNVAREKSHEEDDGFARSRGNDARNRQPVRANETRNRLSTVRDERFVKNSDSSEKIAVGASRLRNVEKTVPTVKDRLGVNKSLAAEKQSAVGEDSPMRSFKTTIKNRLGPARNNVRITNSRLGFVPAKKRSEKRLEDDDTLAEPEDDLDDDRSVVNVGPVKSHIIAVKRPEIIERRAGTKLLSVKTGADGAIDREDDEDADGGKSIASKVIVTPRPLKPLQPTQKRATQSLLLRAVAEANQSVVKQKNPEPVLSVSNSKMSRRNKR